MLLRNLICILKTVSKILHSFDCSSVDHCSNVTRSGRSIFLKPATPDEIVELSRSLENKNSSGEDEIPIFIAKFCIEEVKYVLSYIINKSLKYGIYPEGLKTALIKPLLKTGDPTDINNYRPISLLPSFSKIFEHVIVIRVLAFF